MPQNLQGVKRLLAPCLLSSLHSGWRTLSSTPSPIMSLFLPETKNCVEKASLAHCFSNCGEPFKETVADEHSSFLPSLLSLVEVPVHLLARLGDLFSLCLFIYFNWRRLWRVPWTAGRSNQSILKEINTQYSLEGLMLKLKPQYFGHLMQRFDSLEKNPDAVRDWGQEEKGTTEDEMAGWHH